MIAASLAELRYCIRSLAKAKAFTVVTVVSLGFGIAGATTLLAIMDAVYLRPLPYTNADRVLVLNETRPHDSGSSHYGTSLATFGDWRGHVRSVSDMAALRMVPLQMDDEDRGRIYNGAQVTANFFSVLGIAPQLGRVFTEEEARSAAPLVVLSHDVWVADFGQDPNVIGKTWHGRVLTDVTDPHGYTIIGVMPRRVAFPWTSRVWVPLDPTGVADRDRRGYIVLGMLRDGASALHVDREVDAITSALAVDHGESMHGSGARSIALREWMVGHAPNAFGSGQRSRNARMLLLGVALCGLVIAGSNVASLFFTRWLARRNELVVRAALGASPVRIAWITLIESSVLSLAGCALGILAAVLALDAASVQLGLEAMGVVARADARVAGGALVIAIAVGVIIGMVPAARLSRRLYGGLGTRGGAGSRGSGLTHGVLVAGQVAAALMLVSGAGLLGRDFVSLMRDAPGYDPRNVVALSLPPALPQAEMPAAVARTLDRVRSIAAVEGAVEHATDVQAGGIRTEAGHDPGAGDIEVTAVGAAFFRTLGVRIVAGREFTEEDAIGPIGVAIVNETLAHRLGRGGPVVGQRLHFTAAGASVAGDRVEIVGVVADTRILQDPRTPVAPALYRPFVQSAGDVRGWVTVFARTSSTPTPLVPAFDRIIAESHTASGWQGWGTRIVAEEIGENLSAQRFNAAVFAGFSAFALLLAAVGVFGVVASGTARRRSEITVRVALGASTRNILGLVSRQGAIIATIGVAAGVGASLALGHALRSVLTMTSATDPWILVSSAAFLFCVVIGAGLLPIVRAARVDPASILRED